MKKNIQTSQKHTVTKCALIYHTPKRSNAENPKPTLIVHTTTSQAMYQVPKRPNEEEPISISMYNMQGPYTGSGCY